MPITMRSLALLLSIALTLAGCGGEGGDTGTSGATDTGGGTGFTTTTPGTVNSGSDGAGGTADVSTTDTTSTPGGGNDAGTGNGGAADVGGGSTDQADPGAGTSGPDTTTPPADAGGGPVPDSHTGGGADSQGQTTSDTAVTDTAVTEDAVTEDAVTEDAAPGFDDAGPGPTDSGQPDSGPTGGDDAGLTDTVTSEDATSPASDIVDAGTTPEDIAPEVIEEEELPPPCEPQCAGKACGPDGCDGECGTCGPGMACDPVGGTCSVVDQTGKDGSWCGESPACLPTSTDPVSGVVSANPAYPACLDAQCDSGLCLMNPPPGAFVFMPACSKPCTIKKDDVNNLTGVGAPDGVEDDDAPQSDCASFVDGPAGDSWRCVEFAQPGAGVSASYCLPGTTVHVCDHDLDCLPGDGCNATQIGGVVNNRCLSLLQSGPWGDYGSVGDSCAASLFCEAGLCFTATGCGPFCVGDPDCDTTAGKITQGCDLTAGTCREWESQPCSSDLECSAWFCDGPTEIFTGIPEYAPQVCQPNFCDTALDCPSDFYCRWFWNGLAGPAADWGHRCVEGTDGGSPQGGTCDPAGVTELCQATDLCVGGYCAGVCETDAECVTEAGQKCVINEVPLDVDGDGATDQLLPLEFCATFPVTDGSCISETDCGPDFACTMVEVENDQDPVVPYTMEGVCTLAGQDEGSWGDVCGLPDTPDVVEVCEAFCFGADPASGTVGFCTQTCESSDECPTVNLLGGDYTGRCGARLFAWSLDPAEVGNNLFVSLCLINPPGSSGADCSASLTCDLPHEACSPEVITFGPDYPWTIDYVCLDKSNAGVPATVPLGGACDPNAPVDVCQTAFCLPNAAGTSGVCSAPCDPGNDACGVAGLSCQPYVWQQKVGALAGDSIVMELCQP